MDAITDKSASHDRGRNTAKGENMNFSGLLEILRERAEDGEFNEFHSRSLVQIQTAIDEHQHLTPDHKRKLRDRVSEIQSLLRWPRAA